MVKLDSRIKDVEGLLSKPLKIEELVVNVIRGDCIDVGIGEPLTGLDDGTQLSLGSKLVHERIIGKSFEHVEASQGLLTFAEGKRRENPRMVSDLRGNIFPQKYNSD